MIDIKSKSGKVLCSVGINKGCIRRFELMKEDFVLLKFSSKTPVRFTLGDYCDTAFGRFELTELQYPEINHSNNGFDYELTFNAHYWKWKNKIFKFTPENAGQEASWSLTAPLGAHLEIFLKNLQALGYKYQGTDYTYSIDSTVDASARLMTYDNMNMLDSLFAMAEKWDCECWVTDNIIHFGRCEYNTSVTLQLGVNVEQMPSSRSKAAYATRVYAFGSTRNLPKNYRGADSTMTVNGVVQRRLMLPEGTPYIDAFPDMTTEEAIEQVVIFEHIYPHRVGKISSIATKEYTDKIENEDGTTTEEKWTAYQFTDTGITFKEEYILPGETLKVTFQSGLLNGLEFGVKFDPNGKKEQLWEIVANEDYGRRLPDETLYPKTGDEYILSGFDATKLDDLGYIASAEKELKEAAEKHVEKSKIDPITYNVIGMSTSAYSPDGVHKLLGVGDRVRLLNPALFDGWRDSRIIGFEFHLDYPFDSPRYTVGETAARSRIGELKERLDSFTLNGQTYTGGGNGGGVYVISTNDNAVPTDRNVFSALRSLAEFINKKKNDIVQGVITFMKGWKVGKFVTGMIGGTGAAIWIDENGKTIIEADKAMYREELIVPKITFNCIDIIAGDKANTFAYGTIKTVDKTKRVATLDLLEDQWGTLHVNDICRGVFHNLEGGNQEQTLYDDNGFMGYSGFATSYFTPTRIIESKAGLMSFEYNLQVGTSVHPMPGMNFFAYGNFTDKERKSITYENRYYKRILEGVDTWIINPDKHIMYQSGLLEGLTIGGMEMHGHGTFQKNGYMTGVQIQFTPEQQDQLAAYSVNLSSYDGVVTVDEEGNIVNGAKTLKNVTTGEKNITAGEENVVAMDFRLSTRVQAFKGEKELIYSETLQEGAFMVSLEPVGCTAHVKNGVVIVDSLTDLEEMYIGITVNCEGNASFLKTYTINVNQNGWNIISADLSNEMSAVHCDTYGNVLNGLPCTTTVSMWYGTRQLKLDKIEIEAPEGVSVSKDAETGVITVTAISLGAAPGSKIITIPIRAYATFVGVQYSKLVQFSITKLTDGDPAIIYDLLPSDNSVKKNPDGSYSVSSISCVLRKTDGKNAPVQVNTLPEGYTMMRKIDSGSEVAYTIGSSLSVTSANTSITFSLYCNGQLVDRETILVLRNGDKGEPGDDGRPGDKGDPGENAYTYSISPAQFNIGKTSTGSLQPSSFTCTCYKNGNNTQQTETARWYAYRSNDNNSWSQYDSKTSYSATFSVSVSSSYKYYKIVAKPYDGIECVAYAQVVEDGADGSQGPVGAMPRARGKYSSSTTYVYNSEYRDIVYTDDGRVWMVKSYGQSFSNVAPPNSSYWVEGNKQIFTAIDTALIDGANIAGFQFKNQKMQSPNGKLVLDGVNGKLTATDANITGSITATSGKIGRFSIVSNRLVWDQKDYFGGSSRALKLGYSSTGYEGVVDVVFDAATEGKFGIKAVGRASGSAAIYGSGQTTQKYPTSNTVWASWFDGYTFADGYFSRTPKGNVRGGLKGAYRIDDSDTWFVFDNGICVACVKPRSVDLNTDNF